MVSIKSIWNRSVHLASEVTCLYSWNIYVRLNWPMKLNVFLPSPDTPSLLPSVFEHTPAHNITSLFDPTFFPFGLCEYLISVSSLYIYVVCFWYTIFSLFFSLSFRAFLSSSVDFCLSHCFFFVWFEVRRFFLYFFFYLTSTMWLSLFLWCAIISCADKWTLNFRWRCGRSKDY